MVHNYENVAYEMRIGRWASLYENDFLSWQPERQVPFSDVRLPPPADGKKEITEGEEVEASKYVHYWYSTV